MTLPNVVGRSTELLALELSVVTILLEVMVVVELLDELLGIPARL